MKKINFLLLIILGFIIYSCSSDDSNTVEAIDMDTEEPDDPIVGMWQFTRAVDFSNGTESEFLADDCTSQGRQVFEVDGDYSFTVFRRPQTLCLNEYFSTSGSWSIVNGNYNVNFQAECTADDCEDEIPQIILVNNNTLQIRFDGEMMNGEVTEYFLREYNRL